MIEIEAVVTARAVVRALTPDDAARLCDFRNDNRAHLAPWEPIRDAAWYTPAGCRDGIATAIAAAKADRGYRFAAFSVDADRILATFGLSNVVRGPFQAANLGFAVARDWQGRGLMHEVLLAGLELAFGPLGLHRVMANYLPRNERSARLLARLGFEREGLAKAYLKINGHWEDHVLSSRRAETFRAALAAGARSAPT